MSKNTQQLSDLLLNFFNFQACSLVTAIFSICLSEVCARCCVIGYIGQPDLIGCVFFVVFIYAIVDCNASADNNTFAMLVFVLIYGCLYYYMPSVQCSVVHGYLAVPKTLAMSLKNTHKLKGWSVYTHAFCTAGIARRYLLHVLSVY